MGWLESLGFKRRLGNRFRLDHYHFRHRDRLIWAQFKSFKLLFKVFTLFSELKKSPYVFGSDRLIAGMNVATEMMEFFFPVEYVGKPASEKVDYIFVLFDFKLS